MTFTENLRYSRWERLIFRVTGRWPQSVVDRRLHASNMDMMVARQRGLDEQLKRAYLEQKADE